MAKTNWLRTAGATLGGGALIGALTNKPARNFLLGSDPKLQTPTNFDPNQQAIHNQQGTALQGGGGYQSLIQQLQQMLDPNSEYHQAFEDQQMGQFNEQTLPNIAERFGGGYGANSGALSSSGFGQALGGAAAGLQRDLAVNKTNTIQNALQKLLGEYSGYQDRNTFTNYERQGTKGLIQELLPALIQAFAKGG